MKFLASLLLLTATLAPSAHPQAAPATPPPAELKFTLILSRHGVRPPLTSSDTLNSFAAQPWPGWEVPLGHLTPHGADAIHQMGTYLRLDLVDRGLFPPGGCPAPTDVYLYADTDERNIRSTRSTFDGFAPNCPFDVNTIVEQTNAVRDPLFNAVPGTFPAPTGPAAQRALTAVLRNAPERELSARANPALTELAHILAPDPAHPAAKSILDQPFSFAPGTYGMTVRGPLASASNLVEDLELEYLDAKPLTEVGWGHLGATDAEAEANLRRIMPLHVRDFALGLRTPIYARGEASNLLAHILATLQLAANPATPPSALKADPIGHPGTKLVYLSGHDSNLVSVAALLNLHWASSGVADDTPPDSELVFELWQRPGFPTPTVRIRFRAQTYTQLRSAEDLTLTHRPTEVELRPPGCLPHHPCPLPAFLAAAQRTADPAYIAPHLLPTQIAP